MLRRAELSPNGLRKEEKNRTFTVRIEKTRRKCTVIARNCNKRKCAESTPATPATIQCGGLRTDYQNCCET
jgi:hypothetical protein